MSDIASFSPTVTAFSAAQPSVTPKTAGSERPDAQSAAERASTQPSRAEDARPQEQAKDPSVEMGLAAALVSTNDAYKAAGLSIQFEHDKAAGQNVIKVTDTGTGEVLRQLPPKEMLVLAHALQARSYTVGFQNGNAAQAAVRAGQLVSIKT